MFEAALGHSYISKLHKFLPIFEATLAKSYMFEDAIANSYI